MRALFGFMVALLVGLTGVGAGSLTTPILILVFGYGTAEAIGTTLIFSLVIKLLAAPWYFWRKQVSLRALAAMCLGGIPGVAIGTAALSFSNVYRYERVVILFAGVVIAGTALSTIYVTARRGGERGSHDRIRWLPWVGAIIGVETGFSSAGTGALGSLVLLNWTTLRPGEVVGTNLWFGLAISLVGGGWHLSTGHYNPRLLLDLMIGGIPGVLVGAMLSMVLSAKPLRLVLSIVLSTLGLQLCFRALF